MDIRSFDLYGVQPSLLHKNKSKFKTYLGVAFTALTLMVFCLLFSISADEILSKAKPIVIQSILVDPDPVEFQFSSANFAFVGALEYSDATFYIDESVYSLKMYEKTHTQAEGNNYVISEREIKTVPCSQTSSLLVKDNFSYLPLENLYCAAEDEVFSIRGIFGSKVYRTVDVRIHKCNPEERLCKPSAEIDEILRQGYFGFFFADTTFKPLQPREPFTKYAANYFTTITDSISKFLTLTLNQNSSKTDFGLVLQEIEEINDFSVENYDENSVGQNGSEILTLHFFFSNKKREFARSYTKIQRFIAEVASSVKVAMIVFGFCSGKVSNKQFYLDLCDEVFVKAESKDLLGNLSSSNQNTTAPVPLSSKRKKKELIVTPANKTRFVIKSICCLKKGPYYNQIKARIDKIKAKLNVATLLELHSDVRLLSLLLFEPYQLRFLEHFDVKKNSNEDLFSKKPWMGRTELYLDSDLAKMGSQVNPVDQRIMSLIDLE